jgi:N-formylglutamate deformylase
MTAVLVTNGDCPVVLGMPHPGTAVEPTVLKGLNATGRKLADTDWHIPRLYDGLAPGLTIVQATFHRYVIDANRAPSDESLYPGQNTTALCPLTDFDGRPIHEDGQAPEAEEIKRRVAAFHMPYHDAIAAEIARVKARHGFAILFDCHSIRSRIPFLFEGALPDFNIGTNSGTTCDPRIEALVANVASRASGYTSVVNGRFKGGWTTRHYGRPADNVHAIQLELAQSTHLATETAPFDYDPGKAKKLRPHLAAMLQGLIKLAPELRPTSADPSGNPKRG